MFCPLHLAALDGNVQHAQKLLQSNENPNIADVTGMMPLHKAARQGHHQLCQLLLQNTAQVDTQDDQGRTALFLAAAHGQPSCVSVLIDQSADCGISTLKGDTPLIAAVSAKKRGCYEALIRSCPEHVLNACGAQGTTALHLAVQMEQHAAIEMLIEQGADSCLLDSIHGLTALHIAVQNDLEECVETLLCAKVGTNCLASSGWAPLHVAASQGKLEILQKLLEAPDAHVDLKDTNGSTAMLMAAAAGHKEIVDWLLGRGAWLGVQNGSGYTAMMRGVMEQKSEVVTMLLPIAQEQGVIELKDNTERTVLHWAALQGECGLVEQLLGLGASTESIDAQGLRPLHCAAVGGHIETARLLFRKSEDVDAETDEGLTAIQVAEAAGYTELQGILVDQRERISVLHANSFLAEQEAEEKYRQEQRAIKTAKEKERRARKKAARRERQEEADRRKAEEEVELCKLERMDEVRRRVDVQKQRDKARPALISQMHSLLAQQKRQEHQGAQHSSLPTDQLKVEEPVDAALHTMFGSEQLEILHPAGIAPATPLELSPSNEHPALSSPHTPQDHAIHSKINTLGDSLAQLLETPPSQPPILFKPVGAALTQCVDAIEQASRDAPAGALQDVEQALTVCMDVVTMESRVRALRGGRITGKSRLALWRDAARADPQPNIQELEECGEIAGAVVEAVCGEEDHTDLCVLAEPKQISEGFVPPKPRDVSRASSEGGSHAAMTKPPKWQPYMENEHKVQRADNKVDVVYQRTVHHNEQPNGGLPRPINKECPAGVFVPPAPKPRSNSGRTGKRGKC